MFTTYTDKNAALNAATAYHSSACSLLQQELILDDRHQCIKPLNPLQKAQSVQGPGRNKGLALTGITKFFFLAMRTTAPRMTSTSVGLPFSTSTSMLTR